MTFKKTGGEENEEETYTSRSHRRRLIESGQRVCLEGDVWSDCSGSLFYLIFGDSINRNKRNPVSD